MRCSNCGKDIPIAGNVCPYCHVNKGGDQVLTVMTTIGLSVGAGVSFLLLHLSLADGMIAALGISAPFVFVGMKAKRKIESQDKSGNP